MWSLLLALAVDTANACSCRQPPFQVVGAPFPAAHERLRDPTIEVGPRPILVVSYSTLGHRDVRLRRGRFVLVEGGPAVDGRLLRNRIPVGQERSIPRMRPTRRQVEVQAVRDLAPGDYLFEMPTRGKAGWVYLGVLVRVVGSTAALDEAPFSAEWEYEPPGHLGDCHVGGWRLYLTRGLGLEGDGPTMAYDVYVNNQGAGPEVFWGTLDGSPSALVIGDTDSCTRFAFGEDAPPGGAQLRIVPRVRATEPTGGQVVMLPARDHSDARASPR